MNALLRTAMCSAGDVLLGIVSIHKSGHTYMGQRIHGKCGYPCLTLNALLSIAICSAQDALLGTVSIHETGQTYTR